MASPLAMRPVANWEGHPECDEKTGPNESYGFVKIRGQKDLRTMKKGTNCIKLGPIIYKTKSDRNKQIFSEERGVQ